MVRRLDGFRQAAGDWLAGSGGAAWCIPFKPYAAVKAIDRELGGANPGPIGPLLPTLGRARRRIRPKISENAFFATNFIGVIIPDGIHDGEEYAVGSVLRP